MGDRVLRPGSKYRPFADAPFRRALELLFVAAGRAAGSHIEVCLNSSGFTVNWIRSHPAGVVGPDEGLVIVEAISAAAAGGGSADWRFAMDMICDVLLRSGSKTSLSEAVLGGFEGRRPITRSHRTSRIPKGVK